MKQDATKSDVETSGLARYATCTITATAGRRLRNCVISDRRSRPQEIVNVLGFDVVRRPTAITAIRRAGDAQCATTTGDSKRNKSRREKPGGRHAQSQLVTIRAHYRLRGGGARCATTTGDQGYTTRSHHRSSGGQEQQCAITTGETDPVEWPTMLYRASQGRRARSKGARSTPGRPGTARLTRRPSGGSFATRRGFRCIPGDTGHMAQERIL